jgi:hypothetical protein
VRSDPAKVCHAVGGHVINVAVEIVPYGIPDDVNNRYLEGIAA